MAWANLKITIGFFGKDTVKRQFYVNVFILRMINGQTLISQIFLLQNVP